MNKGPRSLETRTKISNTLRGRKLPPEVVEKIRVSNTGKKRSEETKQRMREAAKNRPPMSEEQKKKLSIIRTGMKLKQEWIEKIRQANLGKKRSPEFVKKLSILLKGKKRTSEQRLRMSLAHIGKKLSSEHARKIALANTGKKRSEESKQKMKEIALRRPPMSEEVRKRISDTLKGKPSKQHGENHYMWKGGISGDRMRISKCFEYDTWRNYIFQRDNFTCRDCGERGTNLQVHHCNISFSRLLQLAREALPLLNPYNAARAYPPMWDTNNGITLCIPCHRIRHKKRET